MLRYQTHRAILFLLIVCTLVGIAILVGMPTQHTTAHTLQAQLKPSASATPTHQLTPTVKTTRPYTPTASTVPNKPVPVWFTNPLSITESDAHALVKFIGTTIMTQTGQQPTPLPPSLESDPFPRILMLSWSDGKSPARVVNGADIGITRAISQAITNTHKLLHTGYQPIWLKVDIVQDIIPLHNPTFDTKLEHPRSLYGLAFDQQSRLAFLPEELVAYTLVDSKQNIRRNNINLHLRQYFFHTSPSTATIQTFQTLRQSQHPAMFRFTTQSFFFDGDTVLPLYRGHRMFSHLTPTDLLSSATQGGTYLAQEVDSNGRFTYSYFPKGNDVPNKYNLVRHAGTVYAMMELYDVTQDADLLDASQRALAYLLQAVQTCTTDIGELSCVVERGYNDLGGNALAAVALAKYIEVTGDEHYMPTLQDVVTWVQHMQHEEGAFNTHRVSYPDSKVLNYSVSYYPGESLLAMTRMYELDANEKWLDAAEKGAQYLINVRDAGKSLSSLQHDHWFLYALNDLYRHRPNPMYLDHAMRISEAILEKQHRYPPYADWRGGFFEPPISTPTATRSEGLCAAYLLARDFNREEEAKAILEGLKLGIAFQLQTQFYPETTLYVQDPQRILGGFHRNLTNFEIRIDYVQHNISSILCLHKVMEAEAQRAPPPPK